MKTLGKLEKVDLKTIWKSEPQDFTPWLAAEESLQILGEAIGIELELEAQEKKVGPFRADILCRDTFSNHWVLIENQLEKTDHTHLGQLITYAAGLEAVTIVWIAARFTEEHRAALDWLNSKTDEDISFFGLEVEVWKIGDSLAAPKFNVVSKPNEFSRTFGKAARQLENEALTETKLSQLEFWTRFKEFLIIRKSKLKAQKPYPQHWANFAVGKSGVLLDATLNSNEDRIGVGLYIGDNKEYYLELLKDKEAIEAELGLTLDWQELPGKKASRILIYKNGIKTLDTKNWNDINFWFLENLEKFDKVFRKRVSKF